MGVGRGRAAEEKAVAALVADWRVVEVMVLDKRGAVVEAPAAVVVEVEVWVEEVWAAVAMGLAAEATVEVIKAVEWKVAVE